MPFSLHPREPHHEQQPQSPSSAIAAGLCSAPSATPLGRHAPRKSHRKVKTCQNWPSATPSCGTRPIQNDSETSRFEQISKEAQTYLLGLMRDKNKRMRHRAIDLWTRHGAPRLTARTAP